MDRKNRAYASKLPSPQIPAQGAEATATLSQRIGESAIDLLKESFKRPSPQIVTGVLTSLKTETVKAGPSSSLTDTSESSFADRSSPQCGQATVDHGESFRSKNIVGMFGECHGQVAFDDFLAGLRGCDHKAESAHDGPLSSGNQRLGFPLNIPENDWPMVQERETLRMQDHNQDFADQDFDGAAVVALLSDPAFAVDTEPSSTLVSEGRKGLNCETLQVRRGPNKPDNILHPSNTPDFVPDFSTPWDPVDTSLTARKGIHERDYFLESRCGDVQPWIDMLHLYHDEVWGDILPLVQEAREELTTNNESKTRLSEGPAIRRLEMVLQHLGNPDYR